MEHITPKAETAKSTEADRNGLFAPLNRNAPCPFTLWRGVTSVVDGVEYPNATYADFINAIEQPAPIVTNKKKAPYATLGLQRDAPLSSKARAQRIRRGMQDIEIGRARDNAHHTDCGYGALLDYDIGDNLDVMVDGPAALDRLGIAGACWTSYSYGMTDETTGKVKRGGRMFVPTDRAIALDEFLLVALAANRLLGGHGSVEAMKPSQPQGLPVRRDHTAQSRIYVSPHARVLRVDALLDLARREGLVKPRQAKAASGTWQWDSDLEEPFKALIDPRTGKPAVPTKLMVERIAAGKSVNENFQGGLPNDDTLLDVEDAELILLSMPNNFPLQDPPHPLRLDRPKWLKLAFACHSSGRRGGQGTRREVIRRFQGSHSCIQGRRRTAEGGVRRVLVALCRRPGQAGRRRG